MHYQQRTKRLIAATVLGFTVAAASTAVALRLGAVATRALRTDVRGQSAATEVFVHVLLVCTALMLLWLAAACAAAGWDIARSVRPEFEAFEPRSAHRAGRRRVAAILLALTGAGALGTLPSAAASAGPLPPATTRSAPLSTATDLPMPAPATSPATSGTADIPQPGWVTPAPSPASQRCAAGARLIAGCTSREDVTQVVVHRGDSLWTLISRHLHSHDPAVIAAAVPQWYAANKAVIGPDPDLLRVGQHLHIPDAVPTAHTTQGEP